MKLTLRNRALFDVLQEDKILKWGVHDKLEFFSFLYYFAETNACCVCVLTTLINS